MGIKKNILPDENILFDKYYNNTCLIVILTIIISINKILKYFNIFIWKIDYSPLRKLTAQINGPTIYFFWGYESGLQKKTTKILRWLDAGEKMLTEFGNVAKH